MDEFLEHFQHHCDYNLTIYEIYIDNGPVETARLRRCKGVDLSAKKMYSCGDINSSSFPGGRTSRSVYFFC